MSKRPRADVERERRKPGVDWLPKPVPLAPGGKVRVLGVSRDASQQLFRWWLRESHRHGTTTEEAA
jgi:hypothetical protein